MLKNSILKLVNYMYRGGGMVEHVDLLCCLYPARQQGTENQHKCWMCRWGLHPEPLGTEHLRTHFTGLSGACDT